ncbi:hypothetical protein FGIG_02383 [Fasciola gigantica]|uniref:Uncharacterized protein n=1 Tax=Fasciola gigantica TaxID=46835 RepID=A0A504YGV3_FASGI|nr:hypothetical protein FGIG_02383 [Fasciola gigantica]
MVGRTNFQRSVPHFLRFKACGFGFECVWHGGIREVLRVIRHSFSKLIKSLITQPGNAFSLSLNNRTPLSKTSAEEQIPGRVAESRTRLVVGLARARSQLNLSQHLDLTQLWSLCPDLARRVETLVPNLNALLRSTLPDNDKSIECTQKMNLGDTVCHPHWLPLDLSPMLVRLLVWQTCQLLAVKSGAVAANATGLFGQFIRGATSSGRVADTTTDSSTNTAPLNIHQLKCVSASRIQADTIRRKAARLLAAKSSLASRADCFRYHNPPDSDTPGLQWTEDQRLTAGTFGKELGQDVQQQLRVWAETNGIHADRNEEQIKAQRDRRKRYRKTKRKAWLLRKLSRSTTVAVVDRTTGSVAAKFETGFPEQINTKQALNHTATVASASSSLSESDHEFLSTRLKETEFMLVDDDSRCADDHLAKRRKVDLSRSGKPEILSPGICGTMSR